MDDVDVAMDAVDVTMDAVDVTMDDVDEAMDDVKDDLLDGIDVTMDDTKDDVKDKVLLKFVPVLKNGKTLYRFEAFENVRPKWELPCEYLSGLHFTAWDRVLLYSDGRSVRKVLTGSELSEEEYLELMEIVELGKKRLKEIRAKWP